MQLAGKVALITGAGSGLSKAAAILLGAQVRHLHFDAGRFNVQSLQQGF